MNITIIVTVLGSALLAGLVFYGFNLTPATTPPDAILMGALKSAPSQDKLGWLDDHPIAGSDLARIAQITGRTNDSNLSVIRKMQSGARGGITKRDFELLRQDRRRAQAAYPDVKTDNLYIGGWLQVDLSDRVPSDFCTSGNSNGTMGEDGKWYLDGGCYTSFVRSEFPNRADAAMTKVFFAELRRKQHEEKLARLRSDGPFSAWSGTGGSMSVHLDKDTNMVIVTRAQEWARTAQRWSIPFAVDEWADISASDLDKIKKLPSFAQAKEEEIDVRPSGVTMGSVTSTGRSFNSTLMPGESVGVTTQMLGNGPR